MDIRFAMLMAHLANLQRDPKTRPQPYTWEDFKFTFGVAGARQEEDAPSVEELIRRVEMWNRALGGINNKKKPD